MLKQMPNGKWYLYILDENNKRIRKTFDKRADAMALAAKVTKLKYDKKLEGVSLRKKRHSFESALNEFELLKKELRPSSYKKYKFAIKQFRYFIDACNITYMDEFTPDHGTSYYKELISEKIDPKGNTDKIVKPKPRTVNFHLQTVKAFFRDEINKGHLFRNPVQHLKNLRKEKKTPEYYSKEEINSFFKQEMPTAYRNAFLCLYYTGVRFGELANLTWEDIDINRRLIYIRSKDNFKTKTINSERSIPINDELYDLIISVYQNRLSELYPFCSPHGFQLRERKALEVCKKIALKAGIKSRAFLHKFRHSFATHLILNSVPIQSIKELLGHSTIIETEIYAHNKSDHMHKDVSKLCHYIVP